MTARTITLQVNGRKVEADVEPRTNLADFLRTALKLTGTHVGCEHGVCGACTVIVDGHAARSCLMLAVQADGAEVETVEGLGRVDALSPLQQAFSDCHALQCGFCTPGMLMTLESYLREHPAPSRDEIRDVLSGNICRCTGYQGIVDAAMQAAAARREPR
ncbi:MAG: (2Fe-2S)-binding protein [Bradyrhizobium sp.]|jgi:aerobic-type carbon monoxide dehydrogenase small subunit (CoxS/CutS family)|uniref:(2Fe-2S)-binding protein n=1 Tax=Bradyrhizobium sp. TaxID=376 RepID=UPI003C7B5720